MHMEEIKDIEENIATVPQEDDATYDHVIKYTGLFGGVQGLNMMMNVARNMIVARILGPAGTGIIGNMSNFVELIHHSSDFGMCFSAIKHVSELSEEADRQTVSKFIMTVRTLCLLAGLLGTLIALVCAPFTEWTSPLNIVIIAPIVGLLTVTSGEQAILKGMKQLKKVALASVFCTLATLLVTVPIFFLFRFTGIAAALLINQIAIFAITLHYSHKVEPYRIGIGSRGQEFKGSRVQEIWTLGKPMIILGIGYVVAGIFGKGAEYIIRHFIVGQFADIDLGNAEVGLYTAGYSIIVTYASYVFTAMEVDFFPRLSAASHDTCRSNTIINRQIEVCALLMAPLLTALVLFMPHIIHILYSSRYQDAIPMAICASLFMYFKAFSSPVEYLALAKGDSRMYMLVELAYDVMIACMIPFAYTQMGLLGCGLALTLAGAINLVFIYLIYVPRYHFKFSTRLLSLYAVQFILVSLTIAAVMHNVETHDRIFKWTIGPAALIISTTLSVFILNKETNIIQNIKAKIRNRITT